MQPRIVSLLMWKCIENIVTRYASKKEIFQCILSLCPSQHFETMEGVKVDKVRHRDTEKGGASPSEHGQEAFISDQSQDDLDWSLTLPGILQLDPCESRGQGHCHCGSCCASNTSFITMIVATVLNISQDFPNLHKREPKFCS